MLKEGSNRPMYDVISTLRGVDSAVATALLEEGIKYTHQLLDRAYGAQSRMALAQKTGIPLQTMQVLVGRADLMRLRGVGSDLSQLLLLAGVNNCRTLQTCVPEHLYKRLAEIHIGHRIAYHAPTLTQVRSWINEAKRLAQQSPE